MDLESSSALRSQLVDMSSRDGIAALSTGAFVIRRNRFLVLIRNDGQTFLPGMGDLPGGFVRSGEDILTGLAREVKEETGLAIVRILSYLGHFDFTSARGRRTRQFNFAVECDPGRVRLSKDEHQAFIWIRLDDDRGLESASVSVEVRAALDCLRDTL